MDGTFDHQDTHGGGGTITNGDTQWMTAGSGLLHIEAPPEWLVTSGGLFHGLQLWVNLPRDGQDEPAPLPGHPLRRGRSCSPRRTPARWCASSPARWTVTTGPGSTYTPMTLVHASLEPGARLELPWEVEFNALVYVLNGHGTVGVDERPIRTGQAAVLGAGDYLTVAADGSQESRSPRLEVSWSAGGRSASRWPGPARS